jgi:hypothetical protein
MVKKWIQKAKPKKGALSRQLGVPEKENIPIKMLEDISELPVGSYYYNPYKKEYPKVTKLLKKRVLFALNVRKK